MSTRELNLGMNLNLARLHRAAHQDRSTTPFYSSRIGIDAGITNAVIAEDPTNTSLNKTTALFQADELEAMKGLNYDLLDKYWETGMTQKHSVNVSGATDKVNYFAGISYFDQDGNLGKLNYNRWNYRAGVDVKVVCQLFPETVTALEIPVLSKRCFYRNYISRLLPSLHHGSALPPASRSISSCQASS
jgi:hypothetical protein